MLDRGESLKLFTTDQSYIEVMALIGRGLVIEVEVGGGGGCFSLSASEATRRPGRDDRGQLDNP